MPFTRLELANLALAELGLAPITTLDASSTTSVPSRVLARTWEFVVDELLRESPWNFAKQRTALAAYSATPLFEWDWQFVLPDDYVTLLAINEITVRQAGDWWEIESGYLLTAATASDDSVFIEYIAKPTESEADAFVNRMDPLARRALATLWASRVAPSIAQDGGEKAAMLNQRYLTSDLPRARMRNMAEQKRPWGSVRTDSAFDASRFAGPNG